MSITASKAIADLSPRDHLGIAALAILLCCAGQAVGSEAESRVAVYPASPGIAASPDYRVSVNGNPVFVYNTKVQIGRHRPPTNMAMCCFDFTGSVTITVSANVAMQNVVVRPRSYGIKPAIRGKSITLTIGRPSKLTIEPDGYAYNPLAIFANAIDTNPPRQGDPGVLYYGPGIHEAGQINLESNRTIYIAGGAIVRGHIIASNATNIKILGHGIIDQSLEVNRHPFIKLDSCSDVRIDGPILLDGIGWCVKFYNCNNVDISDIKEICFRANSDGIDVQSSQHCIIDSCYLRNFDDSIVIKAKDNIDVRDILVKDCVIWSDRAQALEIGFELETSSVEDVVFRNIDVIHAFGNSALSIHNGSQATVRNIRFEDIRIEDLDPTYCTPVWTPSTHIVTLWIGTSRWSKTGGLGNISGVYFKNVSASVKPGAQFPLSLIAGFDANHVIDSVVFENFTIDGKVVKNAADAQMRVTSYATDISFIE